MAAKEKLSAAFFAVPDAVSRLGEALFVKTPLYRSRVRHEPIYINQPLFTKLFSPEKPLLWAEMSMLLEDVFSSTIEASAGTGEVIGEAYADRQADPLNLSLAGNQGSGRAYYVGKYFNIKGEKTPLATASLRRYSDGYLEMERGIWEALIANALQSSLTTGLNEVLAIFDLGEECEVNWRQEPVKRVKIIRMDDHAALDRITHVFYSKTPLTKVELSQTAQAFGRLEGDKFMERIVHGTWSPGNISRNGHFIDFDTVAGVKGRAPQYSSTQWHHQNYFGYEYEGQSLVLKALAEDAAVNPERVTHATLEQEMLTARQQHIAQRLPDFMGFANSSELYPAFATELQALSEQFQQLARLCQPDSTAFFAKTAESLNHHAFDFSALFRVFPLLLQNNQWNIERGMKIMMGRQPIRPHRLAIHDHSAEDARQLRAVLHHFAEDFIETPNALEHAKDVARKFLADYKIVFERILKQSGQDLNLVAARAYRINEDRFYFFAVFALSYLFYHDSYSSSRHHLSHLVQVMIEACNRRLDGPMDTLPCDMRIFREGYLFRTLDGKGHFRWHLTLFKEKLPRNMLVDAMPDGFWLDETRFGAECENAPNALRLRGDWLPLSTILAAFDRNTAFIAQQVATGDAHGFPLNDYIDEPS